MTAVARASEIARQFGAVIDDEMEVAPVKIEDVVVAAASTMIHAINQLQDPMDRVAIRARYLRLIADQTTQG